MSLLKSYLEENQELVKPLYHIHRDLHRELNEFASKIPGLSETYPFAAEVDFEDWLEELLGRTSFVHLERILQEFPAFHNSRSINMLFFVFLRNLGRSLQYEEIIPLLQCVERLVVADLKYIDSHNSDFHDLLRDDKGAALVGLSFFEFMQRCGEKGAVIRPAKLARLFAPLVGNPMLVLAVIAKELPKFSCVPHSLELWIRMINDLESILKNEKGERYSNMDLLMRSFVKESSLLVRTAPGVGETVLRAVLHIALRVGSLYAEHFVSNLNFARRVGCLREYCEISMKAAEISEYFSGQWFLLYRRFHRVGLDYQYFGRMVDRCLESGRFTSIKHILRPLKGHEYNIGWPYVRDAKLITLWWNFAEILGDLEEHAPAFFMRYAAKIYSEYGEDFFDRWRAFGLRLGKEIAGQVASYYFFRSELLLALDQVPDEAWFRRQEELCRKAAINIRWMANDLKLKGFRSRGMELPARYETICQLLEAQYSRRPFVVQYDFFRLKRARAVDRHLRLWEKLCEHGSDCFLPRSYAVSFNVDFHENGQLEVEQLMVAFWQKLGAALGFRLPSTTVKLSTEHPVLDALRDPTIVREIEALKRLPVKVSFSHREALDNYGRIPRIADVVALLKRIPEEQFDFPWMVRTFFRATRREVCLRQLTRLLAENQFIGSLKISAERITILANLQDGLLEIMPDDGRTTSCTDGPNGPLRQFSLVHALHREAFKILVCHPHPRYGTKMPQPFASIPGFRVHRDGRPAILIDSVDVGGAIHHLVDGPRVLAQCLGSFLDRLRDELGMLLMIGADFWNVRGNMVLEELVRQLDLEKTEVDLTLDASDLRRLEIPYFYCECQDRSSPVVPTGRSLLRKVPVYSFRPPKHLKELG